jgi:hypothetical protein
MSKHLYHRVSLNPIRIEEVLPFGKLSIVDSLFLALPDEIIWKPSGPDILGFIAFAFSYASIRLPGDPSCEEVGWLLIRPVLSFRPRRMPLDATDALSAPSGGGVGSLPFPRARVRSEAGSDMRWRPYS